MLDKKNAQKIEVVRKAILQYQKRFTEYEELVAAGKKHPFSSMKDLKVWISLRKKREDGSWPKTKPLMEVLYAKLKDRDILSLENYLKDEKKDVAFMGEALRAQANITDEGEAIAAVGEEIVEEADDINIDSAVAI